MVSELKPWHFIGPILLAVSFVGGLWMMVQLDDYRVTNLEMQVRDLESYVSSLEDRERSILQRISVLEVRHNNAQAR